MPRRRVAPTPVRARARRRSPAGGRARGSHRPGATGCRCSGRRRRSTTRGWRSGARRRRPSRSRAGSIGAGSDRPPPPRPELPVRRGRRPPTACRGAAPPPGAARPRRARRAEHTGCQQCRNAASRSSTVPASHPSTNCQRAKALRSCELGPAERSPGACLREDDAHRQRRPRQRFARARARLARGRARRRAGRPTPAGLAAR